MKTIAHGFTHIDFPVTGCTKKEVRKRMCRNSGSFGSGPGEKGGGETLRSSPEHVLKEVINPIRPTLPANIVLRTKIDKGCGRGMAAPIQIHGIVRNLIVNACNKMADTGGILSVESCELESGSSELEGLDMASEPCVRLTVSHTGAGRGYQVPERILEPFSIPGEKDPGKGPGHSWELRSLRNCKGNIRIHIDSGKGTTVSIYLPFHPLPGELCRHGPPV